MKYVIHVEYPREEAMIFYTYEMRDAERLALILRKDSLEDGKEVHIDISPNAQFQEKLDELASGPH